MNNKSKNSFVTIITKSHLNYAYALFESLLNKSIEEFTFFCFIIDYNPNIESNSFIDSYHSNFKSISIEELKGAYFEGIYSKYYLKKNDEFRWSMKPVVINHILENYNYEKVIYLDSDLYFFDGPDFLFSLLNENCVLLSPHWRCAFEPELDWFNFIHNFKHGIYNGGFIGVNKSGKAVMDFWANLCLTACEKNLEDGLYDDQKYLDIFQSRFDGIAVLRHKGCNVSNWNQIECKRFLQPNGDVLIDNKFPIVFVHFTDGTIIDISIGKDEFLLPYLKKYNEHMLRLGNREDLIETAKLKHKAAVEKYNQAAKQTNRFNY